MKKISVILIAVLALALLAACAGGNSTESSSSYEDTAAVLNTVWSGYDEADKFPVAGGHVGDIENSVMDAPAKLDLTRIEEFDNSFALPVSQNENVEEAASLFHQMNTNTFTAAAYKLKEGTDTAAFADEFSANVNSKMWMCGRPEKYVVVQSGSYVVTAYGAADIIDNFAAKLGALENAATLTEGTIAG